MSTPWGESRQDAVPYTDGFKSEMVKRLVGPGAVSAAALARQVGVSQPTLSQWLREANRLAAMTPSSVSVVDARTWED